MSFPLSQPLYPLRQSKPFNNIRYELLHLSRRWWQIPAGLNHGHTNEISMANAHGSRFYWLPSLPVDMAPAYPEWVGQFWGGQTSKCLWLHLGLAEWRQDKVTSQVKSQQQQEANQAKRVSFCSCVWKGYSGSAWQASTVSLCVQRSMVEPHTLNWQKKRKSGWENG